MDVNKQVQVLAQEYGCDPKDPIFAVLVKIDEIKQSINPGYGADAADQLEKVVDKYNLENQKAEALAVKSAQNITAQGRVRFREKLGWAAIGGILVTIVLSTMSVLLLPVLPAMHIASSGLKLKHENIKGSYRITVSGQRILKSGQTDNSVIVEFAK